MITLTNPETGQKHTMDAPALDELRAAYDHAVEAQRSELVFRAMRIDTAQAKEILGTVQ